MHACPFVNTCCLVWCYKGPLVAGIPQEITITLQTGSHTIQEGSKVVFHPSQGLSLWRSGMEDGALLLSEAEEYEEVTFKLWALADLTADYEDDSLMEYEVVYIPHSMSLDDVMGRVLVSNIQISFIALHGL